MRRIAAGIIVMLAIIWAGSYAAGNIGPLEQVSQALRNATLWLLGASAGAFIAQRRFIPVVLLLWVAVWSYTLFVLYSVAAPIHQASLSGLFSNNVVEMSLSLAAGCFGAVIGQLLVRRSLSRESVAT